MNPVLQEILHNITSRLAALEQSAQSDKLLIDLIQEQRAEIDRLRAAQPEQEPVAWIKDGILGRCDLPKGFTGCLYTSPPKREFVEMTNEERFQAFVDAGLDLAYMDHDVNMKISKVIESRLKEKNT